MQLDSLRRGRFLESNSTEDDEELDAIGFFEAWKIPGVVQYSLAYAGLKLVNYAMFFWLPFYLSKTIYLHQKGATAKSNELSANYDLGQILGGFFAGFASDLIGRRSPVVVFMMLPAAIILFFFVSGPSLGALEWMIPVSGFLIGGPANLISAAIAADLGTHESLLGNARCVLNVAWNGVG